MTNFVCRVEEANSDCLSACKDLREYQETGYCVLHFPGEEKNKEYFLKIKRCKLDRKDYDFGGTVFPESTSDFEGCQFDANTNFAGANFVGDANFSRARFSGERTSFRQARFSGETSFEGAEFHASVEGAEFPAETYFTRAQFSAETSFKGAKFRADTYFTTATFSAEASLSGAEFSAEIEFVGAKFRGQQANFSEADFSGRQALFTRTQFGAQRTDFTRARFSGKWTSFSEAEFRGETDFQEVTFSGQMDFPDVTFTDATFRNATFQRSANFTRAKFYVTPDEKTDFRRATFEGEVYLREAAFTGYTDFYRANFLDAVKFIGGEKDKAKEGGGIVPSSVFAPDGHVSFTRAQVEKPELFTFDAVSLRPSWFVGVDARKFDFTNVDWEGISDEPKDLKGAIEKLKRRAIDAAEALKKKEIMQAWRKLTVNALDNEIEALTRIQA